MTRTKTDKKPTRLQSYRVKRYTGKPGINVIGYVSRNSGLGVILRNIIRLLLEEGYPVAIHDYNPPGLFRKKDDLTYEKYFIDAIDKLPYRINFFALPVRDVTDYLFFGLADLISRPDSLNIFFPVWELEVLSPLWVKALSLCDVIVAQSEFVRSVCKKYLPKLPVVLMKPPLYLPDNIKTSRARFGLPKEAFTFVFSFVPRSDIERKNPLVTIRAFKQAFKKNANVALVIKINKAFNDKQTNLDIKRVKKMCAGDTRIHMIIEDLTYKEIVSLYASCDVFVSLHRSEGLGLALMEAMRLGKPVIATAWSGNMSFMNKRNSCLVDYKLIPAKGMIQCYNKQLIGKNALWAEPSVASAVAWMRRLAHDPDLYQRKSEAAASDMKIFHAQAKQASFMRNIIAKYA